MRTLAIQLAEKYVGEGEDWPPALIKPGRLKL